MPRQDPIQPPQEDLDFLDEVRRRHPNRTSPCGALLAEIANSPDNSNQTRAAIIYGLLGCRRGLNQLIRIIEQAAEVDFEFGSGQHRLTYQILWAVGRMDTAESHACLVRLLAQSANPYIRADVLEAMAFEEEHYDAEQIFPFVTAEAHHAEILSALYALMYRVYASRNFKEARKRIEPLLAHESEQVREYAIEALQCNRRARKLIQTLAKDPSPRVRAAVSYAMTMTD